MTNTNNMQVVDGIWKLPSKFAVKTGGVTLHGAWATIEAAARFAATVPSLRLEGVTAYPYAVA